MHSLLIVVLAVPRACPDVPGPMFRPTLMPLDKGAGWLSGRGSEGRVSGEDAQTGQLVAARLPRAAGAGCPGGQGERRGVAPVAAGGRAERERRGVERGGALVRRRSGKSRGKSRRAGKSRKEGREQDVSRHFCAHSRPFKII
ncbi:hypothetical protein GCM10010498_63600 [Streptomyces cavourensis]|nr:hypothetical protein GCM10010498_63600 [Streptomyces cavourensis]